MYSNDPSVLDKKSTYARRHGIETANGTFMYSTLVGSCTIRSKDATGAMRKLVLQDVHYVPTASSNLISVTRLLEKHHRVVFDDAMCQIVNKRSKDTMVVKVKSDMFDVCQMISADDSSDDMGKAKVADACEGIDDAHLFHNRLCHYSKEYVKRAVPDKNIKDDVVACQACMEGGIERRPFKKKHQSAKCGFRTMDKQRFVVDDDDMKTSEPLDIVMADTCQPYSDCLSANKNKYFFLLVDVHTRKKWIRFGRRKSDFKRDFEDWIAMIENQTGKKPVKFMPDGGKEFDNNEVEKLLQQHGILFEITCTDCPNQNAYVERANGVVQTHVRKLLAHAGLPDKYWEDAAKFSVEIQNAMPVKTNDWKTPNQAWEYQE